MKLQKLMEKTFAENSYGDLCNKYPQLVFESLKGRRERFVATFDNETNSIRLEGSINNPVEANELVDFLKYFSRDENKTPEKQDREPGECLCGSDDWELVSQADRFDAPLAGYMFFVLCCKNCGRFEEFNYGVR